MVASWWQQSQLSLCPGLAAPKQGLEVTSTIFGKGTGRISITNMNESGGECGCKEEKQ